MSKRPASTSWLKCGKCGSESFYRPECLNCNHDLLPDLINSGTLGVATPQKESGVLLSEFLLGPMPPTTVDLPPLSYNPPKTVEELLGGGPSIAGWSVTSGMMECPYKGQLLAHKVKRRTNWEIGDELNALGYGSLIHALLAVRWVHGMDWATYLLNSYDLNPVDKDKAFFALKVYDQTWPRETEPWIVLGIESEVITEIAPGIISSVRYDAVIKPYEFDTTTGLWTNQLADYVLSLERKTTASATESTMMGYTGQFYTQVANWNANAKLVLKYGPMKGVIGDLVTKHVVPRCERIGPRYISFDQQCFAADYLTLKSKIRYPLDSHGRLPRMLNACMTRYGPCQFFGLCHDGAANNYESSLPSKSEGVPNAA